jgi:carnitine O-acetyltransferase
MGLKVQLRDTESHQLFEDEFYSKSQEWKLSTSAFSPGQNFLGVGFGAAWVDGYGINCTSCITSCIGPRSKELMIDQPGKHLVKFGIESKVSSEITSTRRFKHHLVQALRDMRRICESK